MRSSGLIWQMSVAITLRSFDVGPEERKDLGWCR